MLIVNVEKRIVGIDGFVVYEHTYGTYEGDIRIIGIFPNIHNAVIFLKKHFLNEVDWDSEENRKKSLKAIQELEDGIDKEPKDMDVPVSSIDEFELRIARVEPIEYDVYI